MQLTILHAGFMTTIQDAGRWHQAHLGFPVSGFMDGPAAELANCMVGNSPGSALFEVTWTGMTFTVDEPCCLAIAGAEFNCTRNGQPVDTGQVIQLAAGDTFKMAQLLSGVRAYVAIAGLLEVPDVLGSKSTLTLAAIGGFHGRQLTDGDVIRVTLNKAPVTRIKPDWKKCRAQTIHVLRVMPGPEFTEFSDTAIRQAFAQPYGLTHQASRQGFRLSARPVEMPGGGRMRSSGLVPGSLQVTPDGQTILAMHDAQTTGGYPRILVVNQAELHKLAQIRPGEQIYFFR
ncbi:biotin-dependent carboxyltransferase family protein [Marinicella sediminis]|uniref:Biotin-dependent carboxyltransferase family protein n=1 Tax=Marinicella sediminis TaxID=1792834 RepID=A0ABV7JC76_9GAMM|nr:biotin-dependent carboxyltransferase family protein [Marinicella sediminis]